MLQIARVSSVSVHNSHKVVIFAHIFQALVEWLNPLLILDTDINIGQPQ